MIEFLQFYIVSGICFIIAILLICYIFERINGN